MPLLFASCRSVRLLDDNQALVTSVKLNGIDKKFKEEASEYVQKEIRPNSPINLFIYNIANGQRGHYRTDKIRKVGEAPSILDSSLVEISKTQIKKYLNNKGFFNATVESDVTVNRKKAKVTFDIDQGQPFIIEQITYDIYDPAVDSIYSKYRSEFTKIRPNMRYDTDSLVSEHENIYNLMRREGYFDFIRPYVRFEVDTNSRNSIADLKLIIENPDDKIKHTVFHIDSSSVFIKNSDERISEDPLVSTLPKNMTFIDYSRKFNPKSINHYIYLRQGDRYNSVMENLTYDRLYELNTFKSIKTTFEKADSTHLNVHYELVPLKRMANRIEGEFTFNSGRNGFNVGNTYTNRNLLGGSEQLEVKLRYGVLFDSRLAGNLLDKVFNRDLQIGATLTIPRLIVPFNIPLIGKNGMPRTTFSTNWQIFDQLNTYSNRYFINSISYIWNDTRYKVHHVTPISVEYRVGRLADEFREQLDQEGYRLYIESNNRAYFGLGSQYSYTYNTLRLNELSNFLYFRGALDVSGNTMSLISKIANFPENKDGEKTIFDVPFLQYAKIETDFRVYHHFGGDRQLVFRLNPGIAIPYGNNKEFLIFEKNFYAGGMSGVRAWQARTLGPGGYNREILPDSLRLNFRNLDQLGEIKIESNLEYRFKLLNNFFGATLKGATFVDVGNIWRLHENGINPDGEFKWDTFAGQLAIGAGAGLRVDMNYFVFRFDAGIKVRDPQFKGQDSWVISELFDSKAFRKEYYESHVPDRYNFIQYNFGIGMPF